MIGLLLAAGLCAALPVEVSMAPDQPLPYVYLDEPLIVQFSAQEACTIAGRISVNSARGDTYFSSFGPRRLNAGQNYWHAITDLPPRQGHYQVRIEFAGDPAAEPTRHTFCRIARPGRSVHFPLAVDLAGADRDTLLALQGVPAMHVHLNVAGMGDERAATLDRLMDIGFDITVATPTLSTDAPDPMNLYSQVAGRLADWEIDPGIVPLSRDRDVALQIADTVGRDRCTLLVRQLLSYSLLLEDGWLDACGAVALHLTDGSPRDMLLARRTSEEAGFEGVPLYVHDATPPRGSHAGARMTQQAIRLLGAGAERVHVPASLLYKDGKFTEGYSYVNGLVHSLHNARYVGPLHQDSNVQAHVFRRADEWILAAWSDLLPGTVRVPVGDATGLRLTDGSNNPLPVPQVEDGVIALKVDWESVYLSGSGGGVLEAIGRGLVKSELTSWNSNRAFKEQLPDAVTELVNEVAKADGKPIERLTFFSLIRMFPLIEMERQAGRIPTRTAVPAAASLGRLLRYQCLIEQETGEPFIESVDSTLARCTDYKTEFVTSMDNEGAEQERNRWLLNEVNRLMAEAQGLRLAERNTEAVGVALLAEWRARSLRIGQREDNDASARRGL